MRIDPETYAALAVLAVAAVIPLTGLSAQECVDFDIEQDFGIVEVFVDNPFCPHPDACDPWIAGWDVSGRFVAVSAQHPLGYEGWIKFYDALGADPSTPIVTFTTIGNLSPLGRGDGSLMSYRSSAYSTNHVIDVAAPGFPRGILSRYGQTWIFGHLAFVAIGTTVTVHDLTDVEHPVDRGVIEMAASVDDMASVGGHLVILSEDHALAIHDLSDPDSPQELADLPLPLATMSIAAGPDYVVVHCGAEGLYIADLTDPTAPTLGAEPVSLPAPVWSGVVSHPLGYFCCESYGIVAVNLAADPPTVLPGRVDCDCRDLDIGAAGTYAGHERDAWWDYPVLRLPVDCSDPLDADSKSLSDLKAMFR